MRYVPRNKVPTLPAAPINQNPRSTPAISTMTTPNGMPSPAAMDAQKAAGVGIAPASPIGGMGMKKGGKVKCMAKGGSASKRADGIATKGKTRGRII